MNSSSSFPSHQVWQKKGHVIAGSIQQTMSLNGIDGRRAFSVTMLTLWNIILFKMRLVLTLMAFQKGLKSWLSHLAQRANSDGLKFIMWLYRFCIDCTLSHCLYIVWFLNYFYCFHVFKACMVILPFGFFLYCSCFNFVSHPETSL